MNSQTEVPTSSDRESANKLSLYRGIVEGLKQRPAYLLVFGIAALFILSGIATSMAALVQANIWLAVVGLGSFALALGAVVLVVNRVEQPSQGLGFQLGGKAVAVPPVSSPIMPSKTTKDQYHDSDRGFRFDLPSDPGWSRPATTPAYEYMARVLILPEETSPEEFNDKLQKALALLPLGRMIAESRVLALWHGDELRVETTPETTTPALDRFLKYAAEQVLENGEEVDVDKVRMEIIRRKIPPRFRVQNAFAVSIFDKQFAADSWMPATLSNLFAMTFLQIGSGAIDKLAADDTSILCGSSAHLRNVLVNGDNRELTVYSISRFVENANFFFEVRISYCHQEEQSPDLWTEMQRLLRSFRLIT